MCMAGALLSHEVSEITLGKPALFWLPLSATVCDALKALNERDETEISVWNCEHSTHHIHSNSVDSAIERTIQDVDVLRQFRRRECECVGKVCMLNIICFLSTDESLTNPTKAIRAPLSELLPKTTRTVQHMNSGASLLEALESIVSGAQNLVIPIDSPYNKIIKHTIRNTKNSQQKSLLPLKSSSAIYAPLHTNHNGRDYCWLTLEDVIRFLLGFIGILSPLPMMNIEDLGVINTDVLMVEADKDAITALKIIQQAFDQLTAVAVVEIDDDHSAKLIGEISSSTLCSCNETAALALATLSVEGFLMYNQNRKSLLDSLVKTIRAKISHKRGFVNSPDQSKSISRLSSSVSIPSYEPEMWDKSSDEESGNALPTGPHEISSSAGYRSKGRMTPIVCRPGSSLIAVMVQALAHRENHVWVTKEDGTLLGIVTFMDIISVVLHHLNASC